MKKPKVCFFNSNVAWGGAEKWYLEVSESLHQKGYDTLVICNTESGLADRLEKLGNQRVLRFPVSNLSFLNPLATKRMTSILKAESIDAILMNLSADLKFAGRAALKANIPKRLFSRQSAIPVKNSSLNRYLYKNVITKILVNSKKTKETILQNNPNLIERNKMELVYSGIDLQEFDAQADVSYGESSNFTIGNLGRLSKQKAQHYLFDLAEKLKERNLDFKILIGGTGELEAELKAECETRNLSDCIEFVGFVESAKGFMQSIDLFILTSIWEGFGYVLAEAMAGNTACLAFDVSSNPEVLHDKLSGYLIPPFEIDLMADKVIELAENKEKLLDFGKTGRRIVEEKFSLVKMVEGVENAILSES